MEKAFTAYQDWLKLVEQLSDAECGRLFVACLVYGTSGAEQELRGNERFAFPMMKAQIDRDREVPTKPSKKGKPFAPPSVEEVSQYCTERKNGIDATAFVSFYTSKGWLIGKTKMVDWRAAIRTWEQKRKEEPTRYARKGAKPKIEQHEQSEADLSHLLVDLDKEPEL